MTSHPSQPRIATAGRDGRVILSQYSDQGVIQSQVLDLKASVTAVAYSRSGGLLACGTRRGKVSVWHVPSSKVIAEWRAHGGEITVLQFTPGDRYLMTGSKDETAARWEIRPDGTTRGHPLRGHSRWILGVDSFRHGGQEYLVTASYDCTAIVWDANSCQAIQQYDAFEEEVVDVKWVAELGCLITAGGDGRILAWSLDRRRPLWQLDLTEYPFTALAVIPNQLLAIVAGWDFRFHIVDLKRKAEAGVWKDFGPDLVQDLDIGVESRFAFSIHQDGALRAWQL